MIIKKVVNDPYEEYVYVKNNMGSDKLLTFELQPQLGDEVSYCYA